jgi:hypothetical protein
MHEKADDWPVFAQKQAKFAHSATLRSPANRARDAFSKEHLNGKYQTSAGRK